MSNSLKLGLPKGSLEQSTIELFAQAGWNITPFSRNYFPVIDDPELTCSLVRPQEMALYVADGTLDLGLTGQDWIRERDCEEKVLPITLLEYSKSSNKPCRWVLAVRKESPIQSLADLQGKRVATELEHVTRSYLLQHGVSAEVIFSWGATEAKAVEGLVDAIVEITETGSTIHAHGLRIIDEVMQTSTCLIANPQAYSDPWKKEKIDQIALLLSAALAARHKVILKMNIPSANLQKILPFLPSLNAPTISPLTDSSWLAVETVVDRKLVRQLIPQLKAAGAVGILEYDLQKVV
ncbi:ATP phosphoribosyltransferase [Candidatus Magnetaquicoccus inordinatus]|uniref:ATP phosphoribosyltransferase n=1 Tax=Candidatus Magnetaquicoccus inordinatus TaxID=2496818 RepID=UPI00102CC302|nr:ATP phosphoribosyltransferase [Candidatus Magnetaquicoccus inordinatus]